MDDKRDDLEIIKSPRIGKQERDDADNKRYTEPYVFHIVITA